MGSRVSDRIAAIAEAEIIVAYQPGSASDAEDILRRAIESSPEAARQWRAAAEAQLVDNTLPHRIAGHVVWSKKNENIRLVASMSVVPCPKVRSKAG